MTAIMSDPSDVTRSETQRPRPPRRWEARSGSRPAESAALSMRTISAVTAGSSRLADVDVREPLDVTVPLGAGQPTACDGAGAPHDVISEFNEAGEVPQPHGAVVAGGGQGVPVRGEGHRQDPAVVAGERGAQRGGGGRIGGVP